MVRKSLFSKRHISINVSSGKTIFGLSNLSYTSSVNGLSGYTGLTTLMGESNCFNTYKGEYLVQRGSRGLWQVEIVPRFSSRYYMNLKMRYGCVVTVKDSTRKRNVWDLIYEDWLEPIIGEYIRSDEEQSMGLLIPQIIQVSEDQQNIVE